jgi:hypothetical protein
MFAPYDDGWRKLCRIYTTELLSVRRIGSFRAVREEEVCWLLRSERPRWGSSSNRQ